MSLHACDQTCFSFTDPKLARRAAKRLQHALEYYIGDVPLRKAQALLAEMAGALAWTVLLKPRDRSALDHEVDAGLHERRYDAQAAVLERAYPSLGGDKWR